MSRPPQGHRPPQGLSADEAALWRKVAATVTPLHPVRRPSPAPVPPVPMPAPAATLAPPKPPRGRVPPPLIPRAVAPVKTRALTSDGLDGTWDRKLARGTIVPDVTIDLHGMTLDIAHARLNSGIAQALAIQARIMLLITGKPRSSDEQDRRGNQRGIIRAKLLDWLAHSPHGAQIAAVRPASPRHGGAGAVYIVLRKLR